MERIIALGIDLLLLLSLFLLGYLTLAFIGHADRSLATWSLCFGLGAGVFAWALFIVSWIGIDLTQTNVILVYASAAVLLFTFGRKLVRFNGTDNSSMPGGITKLGNVPTMIIWVLILTLMVAAVILAVTLSYYSWDGIALWGVKGYGIAEEGTVYAAADYGWTGISFPLNIPLQISMFRVFEGDILPGSKSIFPIYFASLLVAGYGIMRKLDVRMEISALMMALVGTTPIFFDHATFAYTNLPFTFYIILGTLWCIYGIQNSMKRSILLGGVLLGLSIWTRPEGIPFVIGMFIALVLARLRLQGINIYLTHALVPVFILAVPWIIFLSQNYTGTEEYELSWIALRNVMAGQIHLDAIFRIIRFAGGQLLLFRDFGFLLGLGVALGILGLLRKEIRRDFRFQAMLSVGLLLIGITVGTLYVFAYSPQGVEYVSTMLVQAFSRTLMPASFLLAILGGWVLSQYWENSLAPTRKTTDR